MRWQKLAGRTVLGTGATRRSVAAVLLAGSTVASCTDDSTLASLNGSKDGGTGGASSNGGTAGTGGLASSGGRAGASSGGTAGASSGGTAGASNGGTAGASGGAGGSSSGGSTGADASMGGSSGAGGAITDAQVPSLGFLNPLWIRIFDDVEGSPRVAVRPDGVVVGAFPWSLAMTFGKGETNEVTFNDPQKTALAWFNGTTGNLLDATLLFASADSASSVASVEQIATNAAGDVYVTGTWRANVVAFPGTPLSTNWSTPRRTVGSSIYDEFDPYFMHYDPNRAPVAGARGSFSGTLTQTYYNGPVFVGALKSNGVFMAGQFNSSSLVWGGTTLTGGGGANIPSYFARFDDQAAPSNVFGNTVGSSIVTLGMAPSDASAYVWFDQRASTTLYAGSASSFVLNATGSGNPYPIVKIDSTNQVAWMRAIRSNNFILYKDMAVLSDDAVLFALRCESAVQAADAVGTVLGSHACASPPEDLVVSYGADGSYRWMTPFGYTASNDVFAASAGAGSAWTYGTAPLTIRSLPLDGKPSVATPDLPGSSGDYDVVYRIAADGHRDAAYVVSQNFFATDFAATPDGGFVLAGYLDSSAGDLRIGDPNLGAREITLAPSTRKAFVMKFVP